MPERQEVIDKLMAHRDRLQAMGVASLMLFGSVARGDSREDSDVDLLVEFTRPVGLFDFVRVQQAVEAILNVENVDLVMPDSLEADFKDQVLREAIRAA